MVESDAIIAWQFLVGSIVSTGIVVVLIESVREWFFKKRLR
jgi:hypothetical protein